MNDRFDRVIDYMRVSITDRCNLRCQYCVPNGIPLSGYDGVLSYEEIVRVCRAAAAMGITKFKITGGEPLIRTGCAEFIAQLKAMPGVAQVTLTTNGLLLGGYLDDLCAAGIDAVNISLNTLDDHEYSELTGVPVSVPEQILQTLEQCVDRGVPIKINTVLLAQTFEGIGEIALLAERKPVDVRFIELMPIGEGAALKAMSQSDALRRLKEIWPDLHPTDEKRGNGPALYYTANGLRGRIGFIDALSRQFCGSCNRIRLTAAGLLKPCLCYGEGTDVKALLRTGCSDDVLRNAVRDCIHDKPRAHGFSSLGNITEHKNMCQIGG